VDLDSLIEKPDSTEALDVPELNDWEYARKSENQFFKKKLQSLTQITG
jgi:hypothetical protein